MSSSRSTNAQVLATVAIFWRQRQCNIVIDTSKDRRGIQEILKHGKDVIRGMIYQERSQLRRPL